MYNYELDMHGNLVVSYICNVPLSTFCSDRGMDRLIDQPDYYHLSIYIYIALLFL